MWITPSRAADGGERRWVSRLQAHARSQAGAVLNKEAMLAQVKQLSEHGTVTTISGKVLKLSVDSLCVHGDNIAGVQAICEIKELLG